MKNEKPDSHTVRKNPSRLVGLVACAVLLIALVYIYYLDGFGKTFPTRPALPPAVTESPIPTEPAATATPPPSATPFPTPELPTATPEPSFNISNPDNPASMSHLTTLEQIEDYSNWVKKTCSPMITMPAQNILMLNSTIDPQNSYLTSNAKDISQGYYAARNNQLCDNNMVTVDMSLFGLTDKNPGFIVPYYFKTTDSKKYSFRYIYT